jgi:beta-lactamase regulating signal transducer with metallopeptidase domain
MTPLAWLNHPWGVLWTEALLHFLWQGAALTALAGLVLWLPRPSARYGILVSLFVLMTACPLATLLWLGRTSIASPHTLGVAESASRASDAAPMFTRLDGDDGSAKTLIFSPGATVLDAWWSQVQPAILAAWSLGAGWFLVRLVLGTWGLAHWMRSAEATPLAWMELADRIRQRLGMRGAVRLGVSRHVLEPVALWWWRPVILLPTAWLVEVPPQVLESVLAHELAHLRRFDLWVNFYQRLGETLLFYHPGIWWVSRRIRVERELCCDAIAVSLTGEPIHYAKALEYVARQRLEAFRPILAAGMGGTEMMLLGRIQRVLGVESPRKTWESWPLGLATLAIVVAGGLMIAVTSRSVIGEEPTDPNTGGLLAAEDKPAPPERPDGPRDPEGRDAGPRRDGPPPPRRGEFGPPDRGAGPGRRPGPPHEEGDRFVPPPGGDPLHELMREVRALREEVSRLREEVRSLRGDRGPGGPEREFRGPPRGRGEGGPRPPRDGDFGPGRRPEPGPPDGDRRGPPRGEGPNGRGPREGFGPPREGFGPPREGFGPPREGERGGRPPEERPARPPVEEPK